MRYTLKTKQNSKQQDNITNSDFETAHSELQAKYLIIFWLEV